MASHLLGSCSFIAHKWTNVCYKYFEAWIFSINTRVALLFICKFHQPVVRIFYLGYHALAIGGVARVGQVQLIQPFLTMFGGAILLGEKLDFITLGAACLVVLTLLVGRKTSVRNVAPIPNSAGSTTLQTAR